MELATTENSLTKKTSSAWQVSGKDSDKDPKVAYCGIGTWRPTCLEPLRDIRAFIAAMCFVSCLQASYSGYTSSQNTTLEKRFAIGSIIIGIINSFFEVGYISCVMIVSYLGSKGRVPLWIGCGLFAMSIGAFLFSTPQFIFPYDTSLTSGNREHLCSVNKSLSSSCDTKGDGSYHFLPILLFAQFLIGAGSSPILTLAPPFVDDNVPSSKAPAMIASVYAAAALGPVFGYALGALMLQHPMDKWSKTKVIDSKLNPTSEDWIGLWWAGYIILGLGVFIGGCILIMFPRTLRSSFTPYKRSLDSDAVTGSSSNGRMAIDGASDDMKPISMPDALQLSSSPSSPLGGSSLRNQSHRASHQHHKRSFSGNAVYSHGPHSTAPTLSTNSQNAAGTFFPSRPHHHQRSSSVSSILLHAAIIAATASHAAAEEEEEDEAFRSSNSNSDDEGSDSSDDSSSSPNETERLNKRQSRVDHRVSGPWKFHPLVYRSKSLSGRQQQQQQVQPCGQRWTSTFWSCRSSCRATLPSENQNLPVPPQSRGSRLSRGPQNAIPLDVPPPILDVMMEDSTTEISASPIAPKSDEKPLETSDGTKSNEASQQQGSNAFLEGDSTTIAGSPSKEEKRGSASEPTASSSRPSIFIHLPKRRKRRHRKIIRGRIFGFLADWSKDIPASIFGLLQNKVYVVTCLCICCEMFIVIGFAGFLPKYMEIEYQISKATASMIAGGLIVPSGALGILAGGLILNKARLGRKGAVLFVFGVNFFIVGCMSSFFFLGCENPKIAGFTVPYPTLSAHRNATQLSEIPKPWNEQCALPCDCNPNTWKPVCHVESNTIYLSPCYAGCTQGPVFMRSSNQSLQQESAYYPDVYFYDDGINFPSYVYRDCRCLRSLRAGGVGGGFTAGPFTDEVTAGVCAPGCRMLVPFVCFLTVLLFLTGVIQNPLLMMTMRSVRHSQRSLALGLQFVILRLLANLPSPIAFGRAIDGACLRWKQECGRRGDCAFMDLKQLTLYITGLGVIVKGLGLIIYIVLIYLLSRRHSNAAPTASAAIYDDAELATPATSYKARERLDGDDKDSFKSAQSVLPSATATSRAVVEERAV